ncbi:MAG: RsmE family RNA methyltransferase [Cyanobacteriota bacterium]|nr:RsmE family RNA methyltransferase [Cyanobacteriota bacterium]
MVRERRRLLIPPERLAGRIVLTPAEHHYLCRVIRLAAGQGCDVVDGRGHRWSALVAGDGHLDLEQPLAAPLEVHARPLPWLELGVALPRQDVDLIWRMATELGIDRLQPLVGERSQTKERWPLERWQTILREASEQCERLWLPELGDPLPAAAWLEDPEGDGARGGEGSDLNLLAASRGEALPLLPQLLQATPFDAGEMMGKVRLAIGPEGGWSPAEEERARARGWLAVTAGPTILRTATAAVAGASWLAGWRAALSSSSSPWRSP